ncbi:SDR family oxidoreductase [Streptomyces sp. ISL-22]|uniref:Short-chain dehydrogenase n=2 Tax=Streptomyces TaxID=1883 RepID=A0A124GW30_9ACTN|nr:MULTISPECIES: SDR family NAD(P)-dependent oxidoreductase [Streptomyces]ELS53358.1 putative Short-chain alcohol dehydrogenase like protein (Precursor) [Streptomyces viridochromogenes Tue57]KUM69465.1 short-chain dehydrogenase [Streptomyces curacoi]MBT2423759.1 SDR family oxidoreductase [Streptomyces sp. ISL-24]MBT2437866.1 SDR family oxidoreductase [Streptomyces sp. ISL-22]
MSARFAGQIVLVTGGGEGIGRAASVAFAGEGATVVVAGRHLETLDSTCELIARRGGKADLVVADPSGLGDDGAEYIVAETVRRHGALDVAFNNVTELGPNQPVGEICEKVWAETLTANLTGVWLAMKHEIAHMEKAGRGVIVNTASNIGAQGMLPGLGAYAASKAAVSALTQTAAREYADRGIRINAISPCPLGRGASVEQIADTVVWLASEEASYIVGHDLVLDRKTTV